MERTITEIDRLPMNMHEPTPATSSQKSMDGGHPQPRIGVIYNPRSHRNQGQDLDCTRARGISVSQPQTREDIAEALKGFAKDGIDFLIINGGDGTVRDVLTMGQEVFGSNWPAIAVLPKGKTNALNVDLGAPADWNLEDAVAAFHGGRRLVRRPLAVSREGDAEQPLLGFIFGGGAFTLGIDAGQDAHALGFFNSLAVGAASVWGVLQALFGRDTNRWRRGTQMRLTDLASGVPLPHAGRSALDRRNVVLASTLVRMPMGIELFGTPREGLKITVLDQPRRRVLSSLPAILYGWRPKWLSAAGLHQLDTNGFAIDIAEPVILDGEKFPPGCYRVEQGPELTFVSV